MSIGLNGTYKTYNNISFSANYDHTGIYIKGSPEYKWTFNNEGAITTYIGRYPEFFFSKVGRLDILLEVSVTTTGGNYRTDKTTMMIDLADGTLDPPILNGIHGKTKISFVGSSEHYSMITTTKYPNIKYEWSIIRRGRVTNLGNTRAVTYIFKEKGDYVIYCTITNTKTGVSLSENKHLVVGDEYEVQRIELPKSTYSIQYIGDRLMLSNIDENRDQTFSSQQVISYQIYNLLTGILVDSGSTTSGSYIDTSKLAKGMYILNLKNETYKFTKR